MRTGRIGLRKATSKLRRVRLRFEFVQDSANMRARGLGVLVEVRLRKVLARGRFSSFRAFVSCSGRSPGAGMSGLAINQG